MAGDDDRLVRRAGEARLVQRLFDELPLMLLAAEGPELRVAAVTAVYREYVGRQQLIGVPLREAFAEAVVQQVSGIFDRVYATGQAESLRDIRVHFERPDLGERAEIFIDFTVYPWAGPDGSTRGVIVNPVVVTERALERRAVREQAARAQRRYELRRDVVDALQRELLPTRLPVLPGLEVAASYLLADADTAVGGDWFDALSLPDGRVALTAGDVAGHGVAASATMGQLRVILRERLVATGEILAAVDALNTAATWIPGARAATVCAVVIDPVSGGLSYCTAGHPPPLVLPPRGQGWFLPATGAGPLGVGGAYTGEHVGTGRLERDGIVLLYTDGILERPGRTIAQASVELAQAATDVAADRTFSDGLHPAERVCVQTLELLTRVTGYSDDITVLAGRRVNPPPPLRLQFPARPEELAPLRARLDEWLTRCAAGLADSQAIRHAVAELATNTMMHAYLDDAGGAGGAGCDAGDVYDCVVTAALDAAGQLEVRVSDHGTWREPHPSEISGYGTQMAAGLVDSLEVRHDANGTTATLRHGLTRPARLLTAAELPSPPAVQPSARPDADPLLVLDQPWAPEPRLRIDGPLDAATADRAESAVRACGSAGARDLTVDLTGVTHLGSAGVAAFYRLDAEHRACSTSLRLYAPIASPADVVLTLVGLPHVTRDPHVPPDAG